MPSPTYQRLQALLAVHVETLEQPRLFVQLQTYPTGDLILDLLENFLSSSGGFGSHGFESCELLKQARKLRHHGGKLSKENSRAAATSFVLSGQHGLIRKHSEYSYYRLAHT